ncbi:MAG: N-acyl homoserine lactonase family protein [Altererythrobacter sp.]|jgi:N-acyl homoserine lactone hydrolase|nr:N-acyl homoserine lactonase family protein [Altererythrobacter sp.]
MKYIIAAFASLACASPLMAEDKADMELWRIDCGTIEISDTAPFSDAHLYDGEERSMVVSCYLIRNGDQYFLWDAGLPGALKGANLTQGVFTLNVTSTISEQLADLGLSNDEIDLLGISHYHFDHVGQAADFPSAKLVINRLDYEAMVNQTADASVAGNAEVFAPWTGEDASETVLFSKDHDVFDDGTVSIVGTPGHTPGHSALLVRMPETGRLLFTGDLYHFEEQVPNRGVPHFNTDRADTLASFERFNAIAESLDAKVIIQHDPRHLDRLPVFPESAK